MIQEVAPDADAVTDVVTKLSRRSVEDTVAALHALVSDKGLKVFAVIDHSGEASTVGMDLHETSSSSSGAQRPERP